MKQWWSSQAYFLKPQATNNQVTWTIRFTNPIFWLTKMANVFDPQIWPKRMTHMFAPRVYPTTVIHAFDSQVWPKILTNKNDPRVGLTSFAQDNDPIVWLLKKWHLRMTHQFYPQVLWLRITLKNNLMVHATYTIYCNQIFYDFISMFAHLTARMIEVNIYYWKIIRNHKIWFENVFTNHLFFTLKNHKIKKKQSKVAPTFQMH